MKNALSFVPTIRPNLRRLRIPFLSLTPFAHRYPSQTLLRLKIYQKLFFTHMHNWLSLYICRKNTYQSAVIRSISKCLAPKFASLFTASEPEVVHKLEIPVLLYSRHCPSVVQPYLEHSAYFLHTHRNSYCLILYFVLICAQNFA